MRLIIGSAHVIHNVFGQLSACRVDAQIHIHVDLHGTESWSQLFHLGHAPNTGSLESSPDGTTHTVRREENHIEKNHTERGAQKTAQKHSARGG